MIYPQIKVTMDEPAKAILTNLGRMSALPKYLSVPVNEDLGVAWSIAIGALKSAFPRTEGYETGALYNAISPTKPIISKNRVIASLGDKKALKEVWYWQVLEGSPFGTTYKGGKIEPKNKKFLGVPLNRLIRYSSLVAPGTRKSKDKVALFKSVTHPGIKPARFMKAAYDYLKKNLSKNLEDSIINFIKSPKFAESYVLATGKTLSGVRVKLSKSEVASILSLRGKAPAKKFRAKRKR